MTFTSLSSTGPTSFLLLAGMVHFWWLRLTFTTAVNLLLESTLILYGELRASCVSHHLVHWWQWQWYQLVSYLQYHWGPLMHCDWKVCLASQYLFQMLYGHHNYHCWAFLIKQCLQSIKRCKIGYYGHITWKDSRLKKDTVPGYVAGRKSVRSQRMHWGYHRILVRLKTDTEEITFCSLSAFLEDGSGWQQRLCVVEWTLCRHARLWVTLTECLMGIRDSVCFSRQSEVTTEATMSLVGLCWGTP